MSLDTIIRDALPDDGEWYTLTARARRDGVGVLLLGLSIKPEPPPPCPHPEVVARWDHTVCTSCWQVHVDRGWGIAAGHWFPSLEVAKFYKRHGRLPAPMGGAQ